MHPVERAPRKFTKLALLPVERPDCGTDEFRRMDPTRGYKYPSRRLLPEGVAFFDSSSTLCLPLLFAIHYVFPNAFTTFCTEGLRKCAARNFNPFSCSSFPLEDLLMLRDFESRLRRFASTFERRPFFNWFPRTSHATEGSCSREFPCVEWIFGIDFSFFFFLQRKHRLLCVKRYPSTSNAIQTSRLRRESREHWRRSQSCGRERRKIGTELRVARLHERKEGRGMAENGENQHGKGVRGGTAGVTLVAGYVESAH